MDESIVDETLEASLEPGDNAEAIGLGDAAIKKGPPGLIDPGSDH